VHRIGRTGRAGRSGEAILFVTPREKGMLRAIERATRQPIEEMKLPSVEAVNDKRVEKFLARITDTLAADQSGDYRALVERYEQEHNVPMVDIAAALAHMVQGDTPLLLAPDRAPPRPQHEAHAERPAASARPGRGAAASPRGAASERQERRRRDDPPVGEPTASAAAPRSLDPPAREAPSRIERPQLDRPARQGPDADRPRHSERPRAPTAPRGTPEVGMETFRIEVGHAHGVKPANIVGAIANEAGLDSKYIGRIDIHDDHTVLDLPEGMPKELLMHLKKVWVSGQQLRIHKVGEGGGDAPRKFKPAAARTGAPRPPSAKPFGPKSPHRKGPPKPRG
jgi:ATP-dependent RNA helicase DeaD